jgi:hypothetical protein
MFLMNQKHQQLQMNLMSLKSPIVLMFPMNLLSRTFPMNPLNPMNLMFLMFLKFLKNQLNQMSPMNQLTQAK